MPRIPRCHSIHKLFAVLLVALLFTPLCVANPATDELLRLVPGDAGFCVVIQDLRKHSQQLEESPFMAGFRDSPLGKALQESPDIRKLRDFNAILDTYLETDLKQIRNDILGDAVVLAYWPALSGEPANERGLFLAKARDPALLAKLADRLNKLQKDSGDLTSLDRHEHKGVTYHRRAEKGGKVNYYFIRGPLLALSTHEPTLQRVIETLSGPPSTGPVAEQLQLLGTKDALAVLWLNPRAFDAELQKKAKDAKEPEATFLRTFQKYWKALDGVAFALRLDKEAEVSLAIRMKMDQLPKAAQRFLAEASKPSGLWDKFPEETIFAFAGRFDVEAFTEMVRDFVPPAAWQKMTEDTNRGSEALLGRKWDKDVVPHLGPDWGYFVATPGKDEAGWFPHIVFALQVRSKPGEKPLDETLFGALRTMAGFATLQGDAGITLSNDVQGTVHVVSLKSAKFPPGLQPAFAAKASHLVFASHPAAIARFAERPVSKPATESSTPLARLSLKEARAYLNHPQRRERVVKFIAEQHRISEKEAADRLDGLDALLTLFDRVDLTQQTAPGQATLTLRLQPAKPFRK